MVVKHSMFLQVLGADPKTLKVYMRWHCKSFTDDNRNVRWCPYSKECDYAVERVNDANYTNIVNCLCGNSFCFKCGAEQHKPADCDMFK